MNVVTLLGSPRTMGNSSTIARHISDTAADMGAKTRIFELNALCYRGCQACYACKNGHDDCVLRDDLAQVLAAVKEADLVVLASPIYFGDISSQLKGFMDRTFSYLVPDYRTNPQPTRLAPKKMIYVLTQGHPDEAVFDILPRHEGFLKWLGFAEIKQIRVCGVGPGMADAVPEAVLRRAEETVRQLMS